MRHLMRVFLAFYWLISPSWREYCREEKRQGR